jgi:hypothetical protein
MRNREAFSQKMPLKINLLDLFTKTPKVNRLGENGPGESGSHAPREVRGKQPNGYNPLK